MTTIFVSHAHEDRDAAHQIAAALTKAGLEPWLDVQELRTGDELLYTVARVLSEADFFALVLSRRALTKRWVLTEMRMALTSEIETQRPKVVVLLLDDCTIPIELRHKIYLDCRGRFNAALAELADHVQGVARSAAMPKQTILAEMIAGADTELWGRLSRGGAREEWKQGEAADVVRDLRSEDLEAAVFIGTLWSGQQYKEWESDLLNTIRRVTDASDAGALRILKRLVANGILNEANDLDYSEMPERAWCDGSLLWVLRRAARRSGLFPALPPPMPERLSSLLAYEKPAQIIGTDFYAVRFTQPVLTALDPRETAEVAVARHGDPGCTWAFRSPGDQAPLKSDRYFTPTDLTPANPCAPTGEGYDLENVRFDLATFDDLGLLLA